MPLTLLWTSCLSSYQFISLFSFLENDTILFASLFHLSFSPESSQSCFQPHRTTVIVVTKVSKDLSLIKCHGQLMSSFYCIFQQHLAKLTSPFFGNISLSFHSISFFCFFCYLTSCSFSVSSTYVWPLDAGVFLELAPDSHFSLFSPTSFQYHLHTEASY